MKNMDRVFRSLDGLRDLAGTIGRSQKLGRPVSSGTTEHWERQMTAHLDEIHEELSGKPVEKAGTLGTVASAVSLA